MRVSRMVALTFALMLDCVGLVLGQECESLRNVAPDDLTSFLNTAVPDQKNADCNFCYQATRGSAPCTRGSHPCEVLGFSPPSRREGKAWRISAPARCLGYVSRRGRTRKHGCECAASLTRCDKSRLKFSDRTRKCD